MLVIPPSTLQEAYFQDIAQTTWELALRKQAAECKSLTSENNTLVITCSVDIEGGLESKFHLHYRYFKEKLYCFVEEDEPNKKSD